MSFIIQKINNELKEEMLKKKIWSAGCPVKIEHLRILTIYHYDFNNEVQQGELIVHTKMAENTIKIFKTLLDIQFPINQVKLINDYGGDDVLSMKANNSSCFNNRKIIGSDKLSMHSYGLAIDINPLQNPCIEISQDGEIVTIEPKESINYLDRNNQRLGMVEPIIEIFKEYGFNIWGGSWNNPIDYHHFQVERDLAEKWVHYTEVKKLDKKEGSFIS